MATTMMTEYAFTVLINARSVEEARAVLDIARRAGWIDNFEDTVPAAGDLNPPA